MIPDSKYVLLREGKVVGFIWPDVQVELPEHERGIWATSGGDMQAFADALGGAYMVIEVATEPPAGALTFVDESEAERRRYYLLHNGQIAGVLDALFRNGEFICLANEEETLASLPDVIADLWRAKNGDLTQFLLAFEEEERRFNYLEAHADESPEALAAEMEQDRAEITRHWEQGLALRDRFLFLRALRELEIAAALCDKYAMVDFLAELCNEMGNVYIAFEDYDAAIEMFEEGLSYEPHDLVCRVRLLTNASQAYDLAEKRKKAIEKIEEALDIMPSDVYDSLLAGVYSQAASLYNQEGNYEKSVQLYKLASYLADNSASVSDPEKAMFHNNLGMAFMEHGELEIALEQLQKAVELQPLDPFYLENLARCYELRQRR